MAKNIDFSHVEGFDWDEGNLYKNENTHGVTWKECEEVFANKPSYFPDHKHSQKEVRLLVYGKSNEGRLLTIVFIIRNFRIRVISARDQSRKEREITKL